MSRGKNYFHWKKIPHIFQFCIIVEITVLNFGEMGEFADSIFLLLVLLLKIWDKDN